MKRMITSMGALLCAGAAGLASAQAYPAKPIRIIAPFAPGGGTDFIARVAAQKMSEVLGQQAIVENRAGAGGTIGAEVGAKSAPDGYTFTLISGSYAVNPSLYKLNFDPVNDITAVIQMSQGPFLVVVHPSLPVKSVKELIALAKAKPNSLNYASSGQGSITHLATELFIDMAGIKMVHVPYKGTSPAITDTIAGQTQVLFGSVAAALPQMRNGRFKGIAVSTPKRIDAAPEIPTVSESGLKGYEVTLWHGMIAPKGLPKPILNRINGELNKVLKNKDMQDKLAGDGVAAAGGTPEQFSALIKKDIDVWRKVVQKAGVKAE
ncbi:MAG: tripartite tricarboxylate transporter substrate binding protein [Betaproteobacteria bacterium]|nr:tripartite tricarboxylate transporter substrate binding protein [Betaproteobacteria bacterium]